MESIENHLIKGVKLEATENLYNPPEFKYPNLPDSIIIHYTAMLDDDAAVRVLTRRKDKGNASAHLVIGRGGEIRQLAPFNYRTWHAGESEYNGRKYYNHYSIGIEINNAGWLKKYGDDEFSRRDLKKAGKSFTANEVVHARHFNPNIPYQYWEKYPDAQVDIVFDICAALAEKYPIKEILGHDEIAPNRKQDPGPAFPMDELRREILKDDRSQEEPEPFSERSGIVTASKLNIREVPGGDKVAKPLPQGFEVKVIEQQGKWYKVKAEIEGWVSADFIK